MLLVSACLAGIPCRMDGQSKPEADIINLVATGQAVPVCPEVLGGLPTPRCPSEILGDRVIMKDGRDVTNEFHLGADRAMEICRQHHCDCAVLKSKSPSCGVGVIHDGTHTGGLTQGNGVFAQMLIDAGIPVYAEKDEEWRLPLK